MNRSRVTLKKSKNRVFEKYIFGPQQGGYLLGRGYLPRIERYLYLVFLLKKQLKNKCCPLPYFTVNFDICFEKEFLMSNVLKLNQLLL